MPDPPEPQPFDPCAGRTQWIASAGPCVDLTTQDGDVWSAAPLYPGFGGTLAHYCVYTWESAATPAKPPSPGAIAAIESPIQNNGRGASADCTFVVPQADPIATEARNALLGAISGDRAQGRGPEGVLARIVVLDTVADGVIYPPPQGASAHGPTLAGLIGAVACQDPEDCPVDVVTRAAMPRYLTPQGNGWVETEGTAGGQFGRLPHLAAAIAQEVFEHRQMLAAAAADDRLAALVPVRRFYNESLAFDGCDGGGACGDDPPSSLDKMDPAEDLPQDDVAAVFDAHLAAACTGVLQVAAAGNSRGGPSPENGLACPARWHKRVVPTVGQCQNLLGVAEFNEILTLYHAAMDAKGIASPTGTPQGYEMFDYAGGDDALLSVGGVDYAGAPLVLARPGACPEAVALGLGGVGGDPDNLPPFLSGSSVSAAIATAALAAEAALSPALKSASALRGARTQKTTRELRFESSASCESSGAPATCPPTPWIGMPAASYSTQNFVLSGAQRASLASAQTPVRYEYTLLVAPACSTKLPHCRMEAVGAACSTGPQPNDPLCFRCGITVEHMASTSNPSELVTFWSEPNPASSGVAIDALALVIEDRTGGLVLTMELPVNALQSSSTTDIKVPGGTVPAGARAWLSAYSSMGSFSQEVFVFE